MNFKKIILILLLLFSLPIFSAENCNDLLCKMSVDLKELRKLPVGTKTNRSCPKDTDELVGITEDKVLASLGTPDWPIKGMKNYDNYGDSLSYFFSAKMPTSQRGGGAPIFSFMFSETRVVQSTSCYYAR